MTGNKLLLILVSILTMYIMSCDYNTYSQGKFLYQRYCSSCHMDNGEGLKSLIPPLKNSDYIMDNQDMLSCIIRYGISDRIVVNGVTYDEPMEGFIHLKDNEITNIINYINKEFNNIEQFYSPEKVNNTLKKCSNN